MRYLAEDGSVFESEQVCTHYEQTCGVVSEIRTEVRNYLEIREFKTEAARKRAETEIMSWIEYDTKQRPGRYGIEYEDDTIDVRNIAGAA